MNIGEADDQKEKNRGAEEPEKQREVQRNRKEGIIPRHEKLWVWQKAHKLMLIIFNLCKQLPREERFRLGDQIQRSSKSVQDNIAEGCSSYYFNNKIKSYFDSRKEAGETQNHIREMESKTYINPTLSQALIDEYEEVIRGLNGLINKTCELREFFNRKGIQKL
jgi:four helix bundle protein